ncbi:MAG: ATP-dependent zinc metalloprotease FtsH [Deltaproteobacteria bacterium]|nr:ATP-dependent zinc metalloprotease FtsH [Deltaproteobacteria bacterium]
MNQFSKNSLLWVIILLMIVLSWSVFRTQEKRPESILYSEFRDALDAGKIQEVVLKDQEIEGKYVDGYSPRPDGAFSTYAPSGDEELVKALRANKVKFDSRPKEEESVYFYILANWFPFIVLFAIWIFFLRNLQLGGGKAMSFGKSRARLQEEGAEKVTFADVAGIEESKSELDAIVQFLKDPKKFTKLGGRIPKGVLLVGSPGTGKTLLARAIAGEAGVPFFSISGSDFVEMFVGVGASRVRDLFVRAKKNAPCIVFIDEIDAVGRHRGAGLGGGHDEREQTLNQLLVEMDGFEGNEGVILIAATNRPDVLDPALLRPGRFDRTVVVPLPDIKGREEILKVHTQKIPLAAGIALKTLARGTPGFSGADLANLVNEAALYAALKEAEEVNMSHFEHAKDKILMGVERKSMILSEKDRQISAFHESGHALIAKVLPFSDPVHKVTIVPRGVALGLMMQLPTDDKHTYPKEYWLDKICILFGGRAAEELVFSEISTGASSDISHATRIARRMVCEWGMSDRLGPLEYGRKEDAPFLGRDFGHQRDYSEQTASLIDDEIRSIIDIQLERSRKLLRENRDVLDALAKSLIERETIDAEEVDTIIRQIRPEILPPRTPTDPGPPSDVAGEAQAA